ncbi:alpha/beta hydrolase [Longimicrobium sp.]|uniref:alpha/beta fold hydrolase n=1 Tax=Longimicrobium sp. TaxID=2029185 RepID=UPI002C17452F|nr:alpha/beta hydrolase [Longimicrobium sp.]HSU16102.1 alpha/beta hydrolase [Longimicrobium sp.]
MAGFIRAGGARLEYRWAGPRPDRAPTVVFLHEGLGSAGLWRDFPVRLAAATGCGAVAWSRAGYGASDPVSLPRPVRFMHDEAAVLGEVIGGLGIGGHVLFGHSDGASIALIHAGSAPAPGLRGMVLEAPHVFTEPHGLASIAAIRDVYRTTDLRERLARHHGANVDVAFRGWNDVWLDPDFRAWNIEAYLPAIRVPALVVQGEDDEYGTWRQVEAIQRQSGGPVAVLPIPQCGHSPHREHPDAVLAAAAAFVRRVIGSGAER